MHLHGLNWDLSGTSGVLGNQLRDALASSFSAVFPNASVMISFLPGRVQLLSVGIWRTPAPNNPLLVAARATGLANSATPGMGTGTGEILIDANTVTELISSEIPRRIRQSGVTATLYTQRVTVFPPAGFLISATYDTDVPVFYPQPTCTSSLTFSLISGGISVNLAPVDCGDLGITASLLTKIFTPGVIELGLTALLVFGYVVVHNIGSGLPPLPDLRFQIPLGPLGNNVFPRVVPAGPLKFALTYRAPMFTVGTPMRLRFPFNWAEPVLRQPRVEINGRTSVSLDAEGTPPATTLTYSAMATDLVAPTFQWTLNGHPLSGTGAVSVTLAAPGARAGATRTFRLAVRAVDGLPNPLGNPLEASQEIVITATVRRPPRD